MLSIVGNSRSNDRICHRNLPLSLGGYRYVTTSGSRSTRAGSARRRSRIFSKRRDH